MAPGQVSGMQGAPDTVLVSLGGKMDKCNTRKPTALVACFSELHLQLGFMFFTFKKWSQLPLGIKGTPPMQGLPSECLAGMILNSLHG